MCCRCRHNRISLLTDESATTVAKRATQSIISSWLIASLKRARLKNRLSGPTWRAPADSDVISHRKRRRRATDKCAAASTQYSTSMLSSCDEMKYRSTDNTRAQMILLFYSRLELNDDIMSLKMKQTKTAFASFCCSSAWRSKQLQNNSLGSGGSWMEITDMSHGHKVRISLAARLPGPPTASSRLMQSTNGPISTTVHLRAATVTLFSIVPKPHSMASESDKLSRSATL